METISQTEFYIFGVSVLIFLLIITCLSIIRFLDDNNYRSLREIEHNSQLILSMNGDLFNLLTREFKEINKLLKRIYFETGKSPVTTHQMDISRSLSSIKYDMGKIIKLIEIINEKE